MHHWACLYPQGSHQNRDLSSSFESRRGFRDQNFWKANSWKHHVSKCIKRLPQNSHELLEGWKMKVGFDIVFSSSCYFFFCVGVCVQRTGNRCHDIHHIHTWLAACPGDLCIFLKSILASARPGQAEKMANALFSLAFRLRIYLVSSECNIISLKLIEAHTRDILRHIK